MTATTLAGGMKKLKVGAITKPLPNPVNERIVPAKNTINVSAANIPREGYSPCKKSIMT